MIFERNDKQNSMALMNKINIGSAKLVVATIVYSIGIDVTNIVGLNW